MRLHCTLGHQTSTTNEKERKKYMHVQTCTSKHVDRFAAVAVTWPAGTAASLTRLAVHWATTAVTFTVTFRAKAIYFNDINAATGGLNWLAFWSSFGLKISPKPSIKGVQENDPSLEGAVVGVSCNIITCHHFGLHVKTAMLKIRDNISKSPISTAGGAHTTVLFYTVHTH